MKSDPRDRGNEEDPGDVAPRDPEPVSCDAAAEAAPADAAGDAAEGTAPPDRGTPGDDEGPVPETPDPGSAQEPATPDEGVYLCDLCGHPMLERHCRLICAQCGYQRDCSDP